MTPLTLCMIVKFPPIQGGVSQQSYWLAHNFARAGHRIHVVTNALEAASDYRMFLPAAERPHLEGEYPGGGFVRLHASDEAGLEGNYIPYANPYVSKLAALARDVVREHACDLIWAAYLEPYGVAAALASKLTGVPYAVRHAGSDIAGLAQLPARQNLYLDVLRHASLVVTAPFLRPTLERVGVAHAHMFAVPLAAYASAGFEPDGPKLDVEALLDEAAGERGPWPRPARRFDPALPTFGIYGKVSGYKGMFEVVAALGELAAQGRRFNLLTLVGARGPAVTALQQAVAQAGIAESTYALPFLPHWMVPRFIRTCTAVCFLENRFPIAIHTPQVGFEILACGRCLIVSEEVRSKTQRRADLVDGVHALVIDDPADAAQVRRALARVLDDPAEVRAIGARGREFVTGRFAAPDVSAVVKRLRRVIEEANPMSLEGLQRTLSELYADPSLRAALAAGEEAGLHGRDLDDRERAAVLELGRRLMPQVERFGQMLVHKRLEYFLELFAATAPHLRAHEPALLAAFAREFDFRWRAPAEDVAYFGEFLRRLLVAPWPAHVRELVRYDECMWRAETTDDDAAPAFERLLEMQITEPPGLGAAPLSAEDRVALAPGVIVERFAHPVHRLAAEGPEARFEPAATVIVFTPRRGATAARAHVMNEELVRLATAAGDGHPVAALLDEAAARHAERPAEAVRQAALRALQRLGERHVLVRAPLR
ncbi:glycosyltransferase [Nannocystis bainbridge]|uniref:Glycosyltransferase n=1 Tax=Nannocystis bainbridge TaxID=2995303 RepID=A0ABT5DPX8_9BACT|nr:glycosyltransferase [Nannocystis bainbridge]MDC0715710.1 glycosyltransferase [Nannocystis bainbridge]